jgi:hypothetical protein
VIVRVGVIENVGEFVGENMETVFVNVAVITCEGVAVAAPGVPGVIKTGTVGIAFLHPKNTDKDIIKIVIKSFVIFIVFSP